MTDLVELEVNYCMLFNLEGEKLIVSLKNTVKGLKMLRNLTGIETSPDNTLYYH